MRQLIWLVILAVAGYFAYNHFVKEKSAEEVELAAIETEFNALVKQYRQASRSAGVGGVAMVSQAADSIHSLEKVKEKLIAFIEKTESDPVLEQAEKLEGEINRFLEGKTALVE